MADITVKISDDALPHALERARSLGHASVEDWVLALMQADYKVYCDQVLLKLLEEGRNSPLLTREEFESRLEGHLSELRERAGQPS